MEVCSKERTKARLHQFIVPFFNHKPINQFRTHTSFNSWTHIPSSIKVPAEEFNISPLWVMLANNLKPDFSIIITSQGIEPKKKKKKKDISQSLTLFLAYN
jgi:hypothetical protein